MRHYFSNFWLRLVVFFLPYFCYFLENLIESCWYIHYLTTSFPVESGGSPERMKSSWLCFVGMSWPCQGPWSRSREAFRWCGSRSLWKTGANGVWRVGPLWWAWRSPQQTHHAAPLLLYFQHLELWATNVGYLSCPVFGGPLDCTSSLRNGLRGWFLNFRLCYSCPFNIPCLSVLGLGDVSFEVIHSVSQPREFTTHVIFL